MKKINLIIILTIVFASSVFFVGCGRSTQLPIGEYKFEDVVYVGGLSSATYDALLESKSGTEYVIKEDYLSIFDNTNAISYDNIKVEKEELTDDFIESNYGKEDDQLTELFDEYEIRYRYSFFDESGQQIYYYLFQMDDDIFISQFAKSEKLIFSIDKIILVEK